MLRIEDDGAVRLLTLDRPDKSNALHPDLISLFAEAIEEVAVSRTTRVVVVTGAGKRFCGGLDLGHLTSLDPPARVDYMASLFAIFRRMHTLPQPIIAAVNGPAIAGGFDLAAFCDVRHCSTTATFAQTEILLGITQISYPLFEVIGLSRAAEMALTGNAISAEEAHRIGLVSAVHASTELLSAALAVAHQMAARPPEALFETKRLLRDLVQLDADAAFARMFEAIRERLLSAEHQRAVAEYVERLKQRSVSRSTSD